jgi:phospholipid/cholesterol/gamma-HCH transport system ATP-binding protein
MIEVVNLKKKFKDSENFISNGISFFVPSGKSLCIIGVSGEGKSVLLKQVAGLISPTSGHINIDGFDITQLNEEEMLSIHQKCGYVFQFAALIDSLSIYENIAISMIERKYKHEDVYRIVKKTLEAVNLDIDIIGKYPSEVSGGMKKRIGLARTLVTNPKIILYDEPTSGLDPINTKIIHELISSLQKNRSITSIVISHDVSIFSYVDMVAFLYKGKIEYIGDAKTIFDCKDPFVYQFIRGLSDGPIK